MGSCILIEQRSRPKLTAQEPTIPLYKCMEPVDNFLVQFWAVSPPMSFPSVEIAWAFSPVETAICTVSVIVRLPCWGGIPLWQKLIDLADRYA